MAAVTPEEKRETRRQFILEGPLLKVIFVVALPQVLNMLVDSLYNLGDAYFVSSIGDAAIAAVGVNDSLMMIMRAISIGFGMGSASFLSRALGAKNDEDASRVAVTTLFTAVATLTVFAILGEIFIEPLVDLLGATPEMRGYSISYASWILLSAPFTAANVCLGQTLRSEGNTTAAMVGMVTGNIIDFGLNPLFIYVFGWGVAGSASSTVVAKMISFSLLMYPFITKKTIIQLKPSFFTPTKEIYSEIGRMGIPTMLRTGMMSVSTILINNVAVSFGNAAVTAIVVANKSLRLVASGIMGFGQGFQPIAGYSWGAKNYGRIRKAYRYTMIIGAIVGISLGAVLSVFAAQVIRVFSKDADVLSLGLVLILTQCVTMVPHVWVMITAGLFQALGNAVKAGTLGLARQLLVLIPCVLILPRIFGVAGLTWAQAVSDVVSCVIALFIVAPSLKYLAELNEGRVVIEGPVKETVIDLDDMEGGD